MKYVCSTCGSILSIDRDVDDDRTFESLLERHRRMECSGYFPEDSTWTERQYGSQWKVRPR